MLLKATMNAQKLQMGKNNESVGDFFNPVIEKRFFIRFKQKSKHANLISTFQTHTDLRVNI